MHVLGFQHEHSRHDRDKNIQINFTNVNSIYKQHLELIRKVDPMDSLFPYDHKSITHYPEDAFSAYNNRKTILSKFRAVKVKSDGLSEMDVWKINYVYNCSNERENVDGSDEHPEATTNVPNTSSTTITETTIGTTLKMRTTTTRPISIFLNKEIIKAVEVGNETTVRKLLNEGADVNARKTIGKYRNKTLLRIATENYHDNVVALLLAHGANVSIIDVDASWREAAIFNAAESGYANIVSLLLAYNVSVEMKGVDNKTPLHFAARGGYVNIVSLFLDKGANIEARSSSNSTPLHDAAGGGHVNAVSLLLDKGANIEARSSSNWTPLHYAASNGHVNVISLLLDKGANIEARSSSNSTPLHDAARGGHVNAVSLLLDKGANIEAKEVDAWTPLYYAALNGHVNVVSLLLDKGANIEARSITKWTPLHEASYNGRKSVVLLLLDNEANIFAKGRRNNIDSTPLDLAKLGNNLEIVEILERKQED